MKYLASALLSALLLASAPARADDRKPDTVRLTNGGLVRGTVTIEDPAEGVTIVLVDGTTKKIPAKQVKDVEYAAAATQVPAQPQPPQPAAPPAPSVAAAYAPYAPSPAPYGVPAYVEQKTRRSSGLMVLGIIDMPLGAGAIAGGVAAFVAGNGDSDVQTPAVILIVSGGVLLAMGVTFTIVGATKVTRDAPVSLEVGPRSGSLRVRF